MTDIQQKAYNEIDKSLLIRYHETCDAMRENGVVEEALHVVAWTGESFTTYFIWGDGETHVAHFRYTGVDTILEYCPSVDMFRWKKQAGDESFDVVVEREMKKEEKKVAINFRELANEAYRERFERYVRENKRELISYAEDTARDKIAEHLDDNVDFEEVAHDTIDNVLDYCIEYECDPDSEDLECIVTDEIFE